MARRRDGKCPASIKGRVSERLRMRARGWQRRRPGCSGDGSEAFRLVRVVMGLLSVMSMPEKMMAARNLPLLWSGRSGPKAQPTRQTQQTSLVHHEPPVLGI